MYQFIKFSLAIECYKVCKPQYSYSGASTNADDDAGMPVCCANQAVLVPALPQHVSSVCYVTA